MIAIQKTNNYFPSYKISSQEIPISIVERITRVALGLFAVLATLGIALFSSYIRDLFTASKTVVHTGTLIDREGVNEIPFHKLPAHLDVRGETWLDNEHLELYTEYLAEQHPRLLSRIFHPLSIENIGLVIEEDFKLHATTFYCHQMVQEKCIGKDIFVYPLLISNNHWTLVLIDRTTRTVEFYDSKKSYGDHSKIIEDLKCIADWLSIRDPHTKPYQFIKKINKCLQPDGYQCGPWFLYFLEERLSNPDIDFNLLDEQKAQNIIAEYRLHIMETLVNHKKVFG